MFLCQHGKHVSADLVGDIAVSGDAIGADDNCADLTLLHHGTSHIVGNYGGRNTVLHQLPGSEA